MVAKQGRARRSRGTEPSPKRRSRRRALARAAGAAAALGWIAGSGAAIAQDPSAHACGPDPVCLALIAKDYADCDGFADGVRGGWYPDWAEGQIAVCATVEGGGVFYGFTGPTDGGFFEFFAMSSGGVICRGGGHRSVLAAEDRSNMDGAASFACSDGGVGTAEFSAANRGGVAGQGRMLSGQSFSMEAYDMSGSAPSLFAEISRTLREAQSVRRSGETAH